MKIHIDIDLNIIESFEKNRDNIGNVEYPNEGNTITLIKGLNRISFKQSLLHEIGHLFDWYISQGIQSENVEIRERNAEAIEYLAYRRRNLIKSIKK